MAACELAQMNVARLNLLRSYGPTPDAFTFGKLFPPGAAAAPTDASPPLAAPLAPAR